MPNSKNSRMRARVVLEEEDQLVDTREAAAITGVAATTLITWRVQNRVTPECPPYVKAGPKLVRYSRKALENWVAQRTVNPPKPR